MNEKMRKKNERTKLSENKKICSIYVRNHNIGPSDYYRIIQYIPYLEQNGVRVRVHDALKDSEFQKNLNGYGKWWHKCYQGILFAKICIRRHRQIKSDLRNNTDVVFVQREIFPRYLPGVLAENYRRLCKKAKVIWDFDDDIFGLKEISGTETGLLLQNSEVIEGISEYAGTLIPKQYRGKYVPLPTTDSSSGADNIKNAIEKKSRIYEKEFHIVWTGTVSNLENLDLVIRQLDQAAEILKNEHDKKLKLTVICNAPYRCAAKYLEIQNKKWERELAKNLIRSAHLGIMPLKDGKLQKGKGGFKLIQYLSEGVPVLASNVGFCREVVSENCGYITSKSGDWIENILEAATNIDRWSKLSMGALDRYTEKFDSSKNAERLISLLL